MNKIENASLSDELMDIARKWYLRLEEQAGDLHVQNKFEQWVNENPLHRDCFDKVVDFWSNIEGVMAEQILHSKT